MWNTRSVLESVQRLFGKMASQPKQPQDCTAECAIVFGTNVDLDNYSSCIPPTTINYYYYLEQEVRRYVCQSRGGGVDDHHNGEHHGLTPEEIPLTLEGYATVPNASIQFQQAFHDYKNPTYWSKHLPMTALVGLALVS
jgi:hypothetical protein